MSCQPSNCLDAPAQGVFSFLRPPPCGPAPVSRHRRPPSLFSASHCDLVYQIGTEYVSELSDSCLRRRNEEERHMWTPRLDPCRGVVMLGPNLLLWMRARRWFIGSTPHGCVTPGGGDLTLYIIVVKVYIIWWAVKIAYISCGRRDPTYYEKFDSNFF